MNKKFLYFQNTFTSQAHNELSPPRSQTYTVPEKQMMISKCAQYSTEQYYFLLLLRITSIMHDYFVMITVLIQHIQRIQVRREQNA